MNYRCLSLFLYLIVLLSTCFSCKNEKQIGQELKNIKLSGPVFGTSYSVVYESNIDYQKQFDSLFYVINKSMSTYLVNSDISKLNRNESNKVDSHFIKVFNTSKTIYDETDGVFDPTIGAVVNAWDFGPDGKIVTLDSLKIDSLMLSVGLEHVYQKPAYTIVKKYPNAYLDFNAIAKGYAVDVIADFLEINNSENYLVEIGGEIRSKGQNVEKNAAWTVGIDKPNFDGTQSVLKAINLNENAMATSGTYRKFKVDENGNRYAHIIDAKTGYPSKTNILSVSVLAPSCMIADGYATAFQAMGIEKVKAFLEKHPELKVFLIYENKNGEFETEAINGFPE